MNDSTFSICPQCESLCSVDMVSAQLGEAKCIHCNSELPFSGVVNEFNDHSLRLMINRAPQLLVVDFYAGWCAPCAEYAPIFSQVADKLYQQAIFGKISCEFNPVMAQSLAVKGIPHTLYFKNGQEVGRDVGVLTAEVLSQKIVEYNEK